MPRTQSERRRHDLDAARIGVDHLPAILAIAAESFAEVEPGQAGCHRAVQDARLAADIGARLDEMLVLPGILEAIDGPVLTLVAFAAIGIYRATQRPGASPSLARHMADSNLAAAQARLL